MKSNARVQSYDTFNSFFLCKWITKFYELCEFIVLKAIFVLSYSIFHTSCTASLTQTEYNYNSYWFKNCASIRFVEKFSFEWIRLIKIKSISVILFIENDEEKIVDKASALPYFKLNWTISQIVLGIIHKWRPFFLEFFRPPPHSSAILYTN